MKKRNVLILIVIVVGLSLALQVTASGGGSTPCYPVKGCTPGYWKQKHHFASWVGYSPNDSFLEVFGVGPDITLLEALKQGGGGEKAFMRHAVAGLLNAAHPQVCYAGKHGNGWELEWFVGATYTNYPEPPFEEKKDILEGFNEAGCPLD
jgi:hypothetical protein